MNSDDLGNLLEELQAAHAAKPDYRNGLTIPEWAIVWGKSNPTARDWIRKGIASGTWCASSAARPVGVGSRSERVYRPKDDKKYPPSKDGKPPKGIT